MNQRGLVWGSKCEISRFLSPQSPQHGVGVSSLFRVKPGTVLGLMCAWLGSQAGQRELFLCGGTRYALQGSPLS
eukprot:462648-Pelagomonas_calceolata.AAC.3